MLTNLAAEEPSLTFVATASTGPKMISVFTDAATATAVVSVQAKSDRCFSFKNVSAAGGGGGTTEYEADTGACLAAATPPGTVVTP